MKRIDGKIFYDQPIESWTIFNEDNQYAHHMQAIASICGMDKMFLV